MAVAAAPAEKCGAGVGAARWVPIEAKAARAVSASSMPNKAPRPDSARRLRTASGMFSGRLAATTVGVPLLAAAVSMASSVGHHSVSSVSAAGQSRIKRPASTGPSRVSVKQAARASASPQMNV